MTMIATFLRDEGLIARVMRSSAWSFFGFGASQAVQFGSNLILTRLLFPEAFGMMTLVTVAIVGLGSFSDMGTSPAIAYSRRGDDQDFLDTAWTLHVIRGVALWLATCVLAWPFANFYGEPMLMQLLPAAGLSLLIAGFNPTRIESAQRHLNLGRVMMVDLASQVVGIVFMVAFAVYTRSIWALVLGAIAGAAAKLVLADAFLPGARNRFHMEPEARHELIHFGKWIFLSTVCGFVVAQGDRLILGKFLNLDMLGIYNIGYFLASFPLLLANQVTGRVLIPFYRDCPPGASPENFRQVRRMRAVLTGGVVSMLLTMAFIGVPLVGLLYDPRFHDAGPIVVLLACAQIPQAIILSYDQVALAQGDSRRFFFWMAPKAIVLTTALLLGVSSAGLVGALVGQAVAIILVYPIIVSLCRRYGAWDPLHDAMIALIAAMVGAVALSLHWSEIMALMSAG